MIRGEGRLRKVVLLAWTACMLMLASFVFPSNQPLNAQSSDSTPARIEQAFSNGEITSDQRLLYLFYAVYDADQVPFRYQGTAAWSGTMVVHELNTARQQLLNGSTPASPQLREALLAPRTQAATFCGKEDGSQTHETANFIINYSSINVLDIDAYAETLEFVFKRFVETYGFAKPPLSANNSYGKYPVQVADLGGQLYGYVAPSEGSFAEAIGDNPNTTEVETDAWATCMVVHSDFSVFQNAGAEVALKDLQATIGHEYFHSVQFGYGDPDTEEDRFWYESTAAYIEDEIYADTGSNYQYLYPVLTKPMSEHDSENNEAYALWPVFRYAAERHGGLQKRDGGTAVMRDTWRNIGAGQSGYTGFDNALKAKGSDIATNFQATAISLRFMKNCADSPTYCFSDASKMSDGREGYSNTGSIAAVGQSYSGSLRDGFTANWIGLPTSGTYKIVVNNLAGAGKLRASVVAEVNGKLVVQHLAGTISGGGNASLASYTVPTGATQVLVTVTNSDLTDRSQARNYKVELQPAEEINYTDFVYLPAVRN
jgi:hypothetical protein